MLSPSQIAKARKKNPFGSTPASRSFGPASKSGTAKLKPKGPFFIVVDVENPRGWEEKDGRLLFLPSFLTMRPGVEGNKIRGKGQNKSKTYMEAHAAHLENGRQILPHTDNYLDSMDVIDESGNNGKFYHLSWETPRLDHKGHLRILETDQKKYDEWRIFMLGDGKVKPPPSWVIDDHIRRMEARLERAKQTDMLYPGKGADRKVDDLEERLERLMKIKSPNPEPPKEPTEEELQEEMKAILAKMEVIKAKKEATEEVTEEPTDE